MKHSQISLRTCLPSPDASQWQRQRQKGEEEPKALSGLVVGDIALLALQTAAVTSQAAAMPVSPASSWLRSGLMSWPAAFSMMRSG